MGLFNKFFSLFKRKKEDKSSTKDTENLEKDNLKEETTLSKELKKDTEQKTVMDLILKEDRISKNIKNKKVDKVFFVKNRLINILLDD